MTVEQTWQGPAADFFLALQQDLHVQRQSASHRQPCLQPRQRDPERRFVVRRATRHVAISMQRRLKGRRLPLVQRVRGLHVIVAIDQDRRLARRTDPLRKHRAVAAIVQQLHILHADAGEACLKQRGSLVHAGFVSRIGRDGRAADQLEQLVQ